MYEPQPGAVIGGHRSVRLCASNGDEVCWDYTTADSSGTLRNWVSDTGGDGAFPVPEIGAAVLRELCDLSGDGDASRLEQVPFIDLGKILEAAKFLDMPARGLRGGRWRHAEVPSGWAQLGGTAHPARRGRRPV